MRRIEGTLVLFLAWLGSLIAALAVGHRLFFSLSYLFGGILVLSFLWAWLNVHWVRVTRQVRSRHVEAGGFVEERFVLENTGPLYKLWLELKDHSDLPLHRASRVISHLKRGRTESWHVRTPCFRRGRFRLGPVTLMSGDPFGLFLFQKNLPLISHVVVYPMTVDLPAFYPPIGELTGGETSRRRTHYITTNVSGVRDYAFGDSFNRIHWPSTARTGRLMVKEFELDPMADIWIFLDMERRVQAGPPVDQLPLPKLPVVHWEKMPAFELPPNTEEYAVAAAASISRHFLRQNRAVGLVTYANAFHRDLIQTDRGERQLTRILELLAVVQAHGTIPLAEVLTAESLQLGRNTTAILITPAVEADWIHAARHLAARGVQVTAVLIDPGSFGMPFNTVEAEVELTANHIPHYIVRQGDRLEEALANSR
ncbi:MAG: DUF58 domain-containing protein [Chloroflexi bacterium]|nr:MAG: DUF58 domain-containing protein [Chloroflexota bacterium]